MGAKKRVDKLREKNIMRMSALVNTEVMDLHLALIMLEMESPQAINDLIKRFEQCPRVLNIFTTMGGFNLASLVVAEDKDTLESISWEKCSMRSCEGIRRSEFYPIGKTYYTPFLPVREHLVNPDGVKPPCGVNCSSCVRYKEDKCVGCPATKLYRGSL